MGRGVLWRRDLAPEIPDDVDAPSVDKARGVVTLPPRVNWSEADPTYDLDDRRDRARVYEQVLAEGTAEDVRWFINVDDLIEMWDDLMLPRAVSRAWVQWIRTHRGIEVQDWRDAASAAPTPFKYLPQRSSMPVDHATYGSDESATPTPSSA